MKTFLASTYPGMILSMRPAGAASHQPDAVFSITNTFWTCDLNVIVFEKIQLTSPFFIGTSTLSLSPSGCQSSNRIYSWFITGAPISIFGFPSDFEVFSVGDEAEANAKMVSDRVRSRPWRLQMVFKLLLGCNWPIKIENVNLKT